MDVLYGKHVRPWEDTDLLKEQRMLIIFQDKYPLAGQDPSGIKTRVFGQHQDINVIKDFLCGEIDLSFYEPALIFRGKTTEEVRPMLDGAFPGESLRYIEKEEALYHEE